MEWSLHVHIIFLWLCSIDTTITQCKTREIFRMLQSVFSCVSWCLLPCIDAFYFLLLRCPKAVVPGPLAGHCPRAFTVRGGCNGSGSHVALALRVPPGATGAAAPLRCELVRWAGWAVWRLPHWNLDMAHVGADKLQHCSSLIMLIPKLFATPCAATPKAQRTLTARQIPSL